MWFMNRLAMNRPFLWQEWIFNFALICIQGCCILLQAFCISGKCSWSDLVEDFSAVWGSSNFSTLLLSHSMAIAVSNPFYNLKTPSLLSSHFQKRNLSSEERERESITITKRHRTHNNTSSVSQRQIHLLAQIWLRPLFQCLSPIWLLDLIFPISKNPSWLDI